MGKIVLMPTDTIWGITCDATNEFSVDRVFKLKKRDKLKSLIHLVPNITSLEKIVGPLSNKIKKIIKNALKPTTIIYKNYQTNIEYHYTLHKKKWHHISIIINNSSI